YFGVYRGEVDLAVSVEIRRDDLHPSEIERIEPAREPLRRRELIAGASLVEHRYPDTEVVGGVVQRRELRVARALEIAGDDKPVREGLCLGAGLAWRRGRSPPPGADDDGD